MSLFALMATLALDSSDYENGIKNAEKDADSFGSKLKSGLSTAAKVGAAAVAAATGAVVAFGKSSVDAGQVFDASMSQVAATMGFTVEELNDSESKAARTMGTLRRFAQQMGSTTAFSASEAADALNYMALAGYDAQTSMSMLPNVLNLAASGGIALAQASDMVTDAQSALGLTVEEAGIMVDQMARASSKSNTSVAQLGEAFLTVGANARNLKGGTKELATVLGVLADNGIKGAEGGTHLRNIMLSLQNPTDDAKDAITKLGVSVYDSEGNMRSLIDIITDMQKGLGDMDQASRDAVVSGIFNKADLASINALLGTERKRFNELTFAIDDSAGAAQAMADVQLDNLAGDITLFQSALEGAKIAVSDSLTPALREFVQFGSEGLAALTEGFTESGGLEGAMTAFGDLLSKLIAMVVEKLPEMVSAGIEMLKAFASGIIQNLPLMAESAIQIITMLADQLLGNPQAIISAGLEIIWTLAATLSDSLPMLINSADTLFAGLIEALTAPGNIGAMIESAVILLGSFVQGIINSIPIVVQSIPVVINNLLNAITEQLPYILMAGVELITMLVQGILNNIPLIVQTTIQVVQTIADFIRNNLPMIIQMGIELITQLAVGLIQAIPQIIGALPQIISAILNGFRSVNWIDVGIQIIQGIINGVGQMANALWQAAKNVVQNALNGIKNFLGIHSPSTVLRDQVGKMIGKGLAEGLDDSSRDVLNSAEELAKDVLTEMSPLANIGSDMDFSVNSDSVSASAGYEQGRNIVINVYGAEGQDVNELAEIISEKLAFETQRENYAWA